MDDAPDLHLWLQESLEALRLAHVGYWERNFETEQITLSEEACRIFHLRPERRTTDLAFWHPQWVELIHPEDRNRVATATQRALEGGPRYEVEYRILRPGGDIGFVSSRGTVTRDESGRPRRMFGMMQDVTELRKVEQDLRSSEEHFRVFVDHATDAFFLHDDELVVIDVNRRACESLGYAREELIGMHPRQFDVGLDEQSILQLAQRVRAGETVTFESRHRREDGTDFPVEVRTARITQGARVRRLAIVRDITERRRAEEALLEVKERFRALSESSLVGVYLIQDGVFRYVNPAAARMYGYEVDEIVGLSATALAHPEDRAAIAENLRRRMDGEVEEVRYELRG
ncbi:MAG TPA: PAS domain S-box protein, partial [Myxococcaceae bacterium]